MCVADTPGGVLEFVAYYNLSAALRLEEHSPLNAAAPWHADASWVRAKHAPMQCKHSLGGVIAAADTLSIVLNGEPGPQRSEGAPVQHAGAVQL